VTNGLAFASATDAERENVAATRKVVIVFRFFIN
jgi:hypothetical protein